MMDTIILVFIQPERRLQRMKNQKVLLTIGIVIILCIALAVLEAQAKIVRRRSTMRSTTTGTIT